jgi:uncharacterized protein (DUF362 family)
VRRSRDEDNQCERRADAWWKRSPAELAENSGLVWRGAVSDGSLARVQWLAATPGAAQNRWRARRRSRTPEDVSSTFSRRTLLQGSGASLLFAATSSALPFAESATSGISPWIAKPPNGFQPLVLPGRVMRVNKRGDFAQYMQPNELWPKPEPAKHMLERVLTGLLGGTSIKEALSRVIHPEERVAVKVNGIAGQNGATMAFNFEFLAPLVEGLIELGVKPHAITVFEQFPKFLAGCRVNVGKHQLPEGVRAEYHGNRDVKMPAVRVFHRVETKFVRQVTDASAVINLSMMKDHSLCGFTGALKNMTHGQIVNPHDHHAHLCNPQIPLLYNHPVLRSRVRLHVIDALKIIYDQGPLDTNPQRRLPYGALFASTDAVAMDRVGWHLIENARKEHGLPSFEKVKRSPGYILTAGELGLGVADLNRIRIAEEEV